MLGIVSEYGVSRNPYILIHDLTLKLPLLNQFFTGIGGVRATMENASRVLSAGHSLLIYPGGAPELMRPYRERTRVRFNGRTSYIRLAMKHGVPIVPVAAVGGHSTAMILDDLPWLAEAIGAKSRLGIHAWPLMLSIPWGLTLGPFIPPYIPWPSKIIVELLEPIVFKEGDAGESSQDRITACAAQVERTIDGALARLEAERMKHERPPLTMAKEAAARLRRWIERHGQELVQRVAALIERLPARADLKEDRRAARSGPAPLASGLAYEEARHDVELFRQLLASAGRGHVAVPRSRMPDAREPGARHATRARSAVKPRSPQPTESRIHTILEQANNGKSVAALCKESGISPSTFYRWRARHLVAKGGNGAGDRAPTNPRRDERRSRRGAPRAGAAAET